MPTTYEGRVGRVVGVLWGGLWIVTGAVLVGGFLLGGGLLPSGLERTVDELAPWLAGGLTRSLVVLSVLGLLGVVFLVAGVLHVRSAVVESDYSITFREGP